MPTPPRALEPEIDSPGTRVAVTMGQPATSTAEYASTDCHKQEKPACAADGGPWPHPIERPTCAGSAATVQVGTFAAPIGGCTPSRAFVRPMPRTPSWHERILEPKCDNCLPRPEATAMKTQTTGAVCCCSDLQHAAGTDWLPHTRAHRARNAPLWAVSSWISTSSST